MDARLRTLIFEPVLSTVLQLPGDGSFEVTPHLLGIFCDYPNCTPKIKCDDHLFLIHGIKQFFDKIDGLFYILDNISTAQKDNVIRFLISQLDHQISQDYLRITTLDEYQSIRDAILTLIFKDLPSNEIFLSEPFLLHSLAKIQAAMIFNIYQYDSDEAGIIMQNVLSILNPHNVAFLINYFTLQLKHKPSIINYNYDQIVANMAIDGFENALFNIMWQGIEANIPIALKALSDLISWIDSNFLHNPLILERLKIALDSPDIHINEASFLCLRAYFKRENEPSTLLDICNSFGILDKLDSFIQNEKSEGDELNTASRVLSALCKVFLDNPIITASIFEHLCRLFDVICLKNWEMTRKRIFKQLRTILQKYPELAPTLIEFGQHVCEKVSSQNPVDGEILFAQGLELIHYSIMILQKNEQEAPLLLEPVKDILLQANESQNIDQLSCAIEGIAYFKQDQISFEDRDNILSTFSDMLDVDDPELISNLNFAKFIVSFIQIITYFLTNQRNPEYLETIKPIWPHCFLAACRILTDNGWWDSEIGERAIKYLIIIFAKANTNVLTEIENKLQDIVFQLINIINPNNLTLASNLINCAQIESRIDIIGNVVDFFNQQIHDKTNDDIYDMKELIIQNLNFLQLLDYSEIGQEFIENDLFNYYQRLFPAINYIYQSKNDKEIFTPYILSSTKTLRALAFQFIIDYLLDTKSIKPPILSAIAEAAVILNPDDDGDKEYLMKILSLIVPAFVKENFSFKNENENKKKSEDDFQIMKEFLTNGSFFLGKFFDEFLGDEDKALVFPKIVQAVADLTQPIYILVPLLEFIVSHFDDDPDDIMSYSAYQSFVDMVGPDSSFYYPDDSLANGLTAFIQLHMCMIKKSPKYIDSIKKQFPDQDKREEHKDSPSKLYIAILNEENETTREQMIQQFIERFRPPSPEEECEEEAYE